MQDERRKRLTRATPSCVPVPAFGKILLEDICEPGTCALILGGRRFAPPCHDPGARGEAGMRCGGAAAEMSHRATANVGRKPNVGSVGSPPSREVCRAVSLAITGPIMEVVDQGPDLHKERESEKVFCHATSAHMPLVRRHTHPQCGRPHCPHCPHSRYVTIRTLVPYVDHE